MQIVWKWARPPKLAALEGMTANARDVGERVLKPMAPEIAGWIAKRLASGYQADRLGGRVPIPGYSKHYEELRRSLGLSTRANLTVTGTLLSHLSGRIMPLDEHSFELRIAPWGRVGKAPRKSGRVGPSGEERAGYYWRSPYLTLRGTPVAGMWIRSAKMRIKVRSPLVYNAHLMNRLAQRLGDGRWLSGRQTETVLMRLTGEESREIRDRVRAASNTAASEALKKFVGL